MRLLPLCFLATVLVLGSSGLAYRSDAAPPPAGADKATLDKATPGKAGPGKAQKPGAKSDAPAASSSTSLIETEARNAFIVDMKTGTVLLDKNADERIPPASMSKMMFYYTVFGYLKEG